MSEAARLPTRSAEISVPEPIPPEPPSAPDVFLDEPQRPPLTADPPINQNARVPRPAPLGFETEDRPRWGIARVLAWIILAPWYVAIAAAAVGVDLMFVKDLLGF